MRRAEWRERPARRTAARRRVPEETSSEGEEYLERPALRAARTGRDRRGGRCVPEKTGAEGGAWRERRVEGETGAEGGTVGETGAEGGAYLERPAQRAALEPPLGARGRLWARAEVAAAVERRDEVLMLRRSSSADPKIPNLGYAPGPRVSQRRIRLQPSQCITS